MQLGLPDCWEKRRRTLRWAHFYWAQSPELIADLKKFGGLSDDFWISYVIQSLRQYDCSNEQAQLLAPDIYHRMSNEYQPSDHIPEDIPPTLEKLKNSGFQLAVVSNRGMPYDEQLKSLGLYEYFSFSLAAGEINSWKPEPGIFQEAIRRLGIQANQAIYVGDNYYADVVGARNAGLQPLLYDPENIFTDPDCPVIQLISEICTWLNQPGPQTNGC